ncbi:MAG: hypothetical protein JWM33_3235, partial [Caulobacteraceae bacterium]|nr:hypothetical protein [Caulobacteraceae bacterium]
RGYYESENDPQDALTMRLSLTGQPSTPINGGDDFPPRS